MYDSVRFSRINEPLRKRSASSPPQCWQQNASPGLAKCSWIERISSFADVNRAIPMCAPCMYTRATSRAKGARMRALARETKLIEPVLFVVTLKTSCDKESCSPCADMFVSSVFLFARLAVSPLLTYARFLAFRKRETIVPPPLLPVKSCSLPWNF